MDNAERFVRASRVNSVGKSWSGALPERRGLPRCAIRSDRVNEPQPRFDERGRRKWTPLPLGGDADAAETPAGPDITAPPNFAGCHDHMPAPR